MYLLCLVGWCVISVPIVVVLLVVLHSSATNLACASDQTLSLMAKGRPRQTKKGKCGDT